MLKNKKMVIGILWNKEAPAVPRNPRITIFLTKVFLLVLLSLFTTVAISHMALPLEPDSEVYSAFHFTMYANNAK